MCMCIRLIDWLIDGEREKGERENIKNISNWVLVYFVYDTFSLRNYYWCAIRENMDKITVQCINSFYISADFATDVVKQKWDRVKIICRQPFRRNVQMGLSFVCFKTTEADAISSPENKLNTPKSVKSIQKHFFGKLSSR